MSPNRLFRSAFWTLPALLALSAACSSATSEPVGEGTGAFTTQTWVDGNVLSFKAFPSNIVPGLVYVLGTDGNLWREIGSMSNRTWVDGNVRDYQPIDENVIYVLGTDGNLWRETGSMASRTPVSSGVSAFQVATDGAIYVLDTASTLWLLNNPRHPTDPPTILAYTVRGFQRTYHDQETLDGSCTSALYVLRTNGTLWRSDEFYTPTSEHQLETGLSSFRALGGMNYYAETTDSKLWFEHNTSTGRSFVDTNVQLFWGLDDQTSFVEDTRFNLWREQFNSRNRDLVDVNVKAFQPLGEDSAYVLHRDGSLFLESIAAPACSYEHRTAACNTFGQNETFAAAWAVQTVSATCPKIPGVGGAWKPMVNGVVPNDTVSITPECPADMPGCCLYVWSSPTGAMQDPSVLCRPNDAKIVAFDVCGRGYPQGGGTCDAPGGGGCSSCRW